MQRLSPRLNKLVKIDTSRSIHKLVPWLYKQSSSINCTYIQFLSSSFHSLLFLCPLIAAHSSETLLSHRNSYLLSYYQWNWAWMRNKIKIKSMGNFVPRNVIVRKYDCHPLLFIWNRCMASSVAMKKKGTKSSSIKIDCDTFFSSSYSALFLVFFIQN